MYSHYRLKTLSEYYIIVNIFRSLKHYCCNILECNIACKHICVLLSLNILKYVWSIQNGNLFYSITHVYMDSRMFQFPNVKWRQAPHDVGHSWPTLTEETCLLWRHHHVVTVQYKTRASAGLFLIESRCKICRTSLQIMVTLIAALVGVKTFQL